MCLAHLSDILSIIISLCLSPCLSHRISLFPLFSCLVDICLLTYIPYLLSSYSSIINGREVMELGCALRNVISQMKRCHVRRGPAISYHPSALAQRGGAASGLEWDRRVGLVFSFKTGSGLPCIYVYYFITFWIYLLIYHFFYTLWKINCIKSIDGLSFLIFSFPPSFSLVPLAYNNLLFRYGHTDRMKTTITEN